MSEYQTLNSLLADLSAADPDLPLIFTTQDGEIGKGYHVTELKEHAIRSIDCGGRVAEWSETQVQLLDGRDGRHMAVGKFAGIAGKSLSALPGLGAVPLSFEFAHNNDGLRRYEVASINVGEDAVQLRLADARAECKVITQPSPDMKISTSSCCGPSARQSSCC